MYNTNTKFNEKEEGTLKKLLKISSLAVTAVIATLGLVACSPKDYEGLVQIPEQYYIVYEVLNEDHTISTTAKGLDENGNYYYDDAATEYLFIFNNDRYDQYVKTDENWVKDTNPVTLAYIENLTKGFDEYTKRSMDSFINGYEKQEEITLLEKACTVYTLENALVNFFMDYELVMENETGVCMSYYEIPAIGKEEKKGFECVTFQTTDIDFSTLLNE